jgi:hypothetical protein
MLIPFAFVNVSLKNSIVIVFDNQSMQKCFGFVAFGLTW